MKSNQLYDWDRYVFSLSGLTKRAFQAGFLILIRVPKIGEQEQETKPDGFLYLHTADLDA